MLQQRAGQQRGQPGREERERAELLKAESGPFSTRGPSEELKGAKFGDIFLKAEGQEVLPFPAPTYAMFIFFFALVSILSLNVLVGLTVEDIRRYLEQADLMALSMKLEYTLNIQRWKKRRLAVGRIIRKPLSFR